MPIVPSTNFICSTWFSKIQWSIKSKKTFLKKRISSRLLAFMSWLLHKLNLKACKPFFKEIYRLMLFLPFCEYINKYICTIYTSTSCSVFLNKFITTQSLGSIKSVIWKIGLKSKFKTFKWNSLVCIMSKSLPCFFAPHFFEL